MKLCVVLPIYDGLWMVGTTIIHDDCEHLYMSLAFFLLSLYSSLTNSHDFLVIFIQINPYIFHFADIVNVYLTQVRLIGYCIESSLFLVYEFIENGNLSQHLRGAGGYYVASYDCPCLF
jgi:hypothetical protein